MASVVSAINNTVPISQFNRGLAGKIFDEVKKYGAECVLLSPEEYMRMIDEIEDARLCALAEARMEHFDAEKTISFDDMNRKLGIKEEDLTDFDEVELE